MLAIINNPAKFNKPINRTDSREQVALLWRFRDELE